MKIFFLRREGLTEKFIKGDRIELYPDTPWDSNGHPWDDYGYRTTFEAKLFYKDKEYDLPNIKILIENKTNTHDVFKKLLKKSKKKYIGFPLKKINYISLPTDILWYKTLYSLAEKNKDSSLVGDTLKILHDANYIRYKDIKNKSYALLESEGFKVSLLRDMTARNAFENGWSIIEDEIKTLQKDSFSLEFQLDSFTNIHKVEINFKESIFPNNINVLIGSNGTGKSQTLAYLIDSLLGIGDSIQLKKIPSFNQIVVIALSPFENFRTTLNDVSINVKSVYRYFGFKDENKSFDENLPSRNSVDSILSMLQDDLELDFLLDRPNKHDTFMKVIGKAIDFDNIGFAIKEEFPDLEPYDLNEIIDSKYYMIVDKNQLLNEIENYEEYFIKDEGILFIKNDKIINLSSGQKIFAQLISSIIGSIREDTILLIDEPELYLHPNLEVELIDLLKELLKIYKSYAIIATHSAIVAREIPQKYITVLKRKKNEIKIYRPPFETFGGDIERINSYVFFDKDIKKPFEKWLQKLVNKEGSAKKAIKKYGDQLNEESIILMYGMKVENAD